MLFFQVRYIIRTSLRICNYSQKGTAQPLRNLKYTRAVAGNGGSGCVSFLSLWSNENAGPDGGDGGNGGHVIFQADNDIKDLAHIPTILRSESGEKGRNKDCHGRNAPHYIVKVPLGTIVKNIDGKVVGDLAYEGLMFVAARGGAGGKGNHYFITDTEQAPEIAEIGAVGEDLEYTLEIRSIAHIGLLGFPNAGKSTLLRAISRAKPKVAPYPFTTLRPHLGIVQYDDYEQVRIADLPGIIPDSHKNRGLGIQFLRHIERCSALLYIVDISCEKPWNYLNTLQLELEQFNSNLLTRPQLIIANKIDLADSSANLEQFKKETDLKIIPISAKLGLNLKELLREIKMLYDNNKEPL